MDSEAPHMYIWLAMLRFGRTVRRMNAVYPTESPSRNIIYSAILRLIPGRYHLHTGDRTGCHWPDFGQCVVLLLETVWTSEGGDMQYKDLWACFSLAPHRLCTSSIAVGSIISSDRAGIHAANQVGRLYATGHLNPIRHHVRNLGNE